MPKGLVNESSLNDIAEAINVLKGVEDTYYPSEMGAEIIDAIPSVTKSGDIVSITDAAAYPAEECVVTLEPEQDLHGYSSPWPAGGGKNLFDKDAAVTGLLRASGSIATSYDNWATSAFIEVEGFTDIYISGVQDSVETARGGAWYDSDKTFLSYFAISTVIEDGHLTVPPNAAYIRFSVVTTNLDTAQLELGTTATSYEPYSNECPISGHTGVELTRTGKNLFDGELELGDISSSDGSNVNNNYAVRTKNYIPVNLNETYTLSRDNSESYTNFRLYDKNKNYIGTSDSSQLILVSGSSKTQPMTNGISSCTFYFTDDVAYLRFKNNTNNTSIKFQLELGSTATTYEPYKNNTFPVTFPAEAGTVYGGEVDFVRGKLKVTDVSVDLGSLNWAYAQAAQISYFYSQSISGFKFVDNDSKNYSCSEYKSISVNERYIDMSIFINSSKNIVITDSRYSDATAFTSAMDGVQFVYELATPIEYDLTPQQIALFKQYNNLFADNGETEVQYKVDLNSYIQKLIDEAST